MIAHNPFIAQLKRTDMPNLFLVRIQKYPGQVPKMDRKKVPSGSRHFLSRVFHYIIERVNL